MDDLEALERRLTPEGDLAEFDRQAIETVAALILRAREAARIIAAEGVVTSTDRGVLIEHPAVKVERMASAEVRGWMKDRPDLFGAESPEEKGKKQVGVFPGLQSV